MVFTSSSENNIFIQFKSVTYKLELFKNKLYKGLTNFEYGITVKIMDFQDVLFELIFPLGHPKPS
jgi:hypothetical protein